MLSAFLPLVYIQITPELLTVRNVKTGTTVAEIPELAISMEPKVRILAVGPQARLAAASEPATVVNPFAHPRTLVSDFTVAEQLLKYQLRRVQTAAIWRPARTGSFSSLRARSACSSPPALPIN